MSKYLAYVLLLFLVACSGTNYQPSEKSRIVNEIRAKTARRLKIELGLEPAGFGGQMMDEVKMLALAFDYNKPIEMEEGRKLLVEAVHTFVSMVNANEAIRPYLYNYPFEPKNIIVTIYLKNPDRSSIEPEKLCIVSADEGNIRYEVEDSKTTLLRTIYSESFAEAERKVKDYTKSS